MKMEEYSPKELAIFEATLGLLSSGEDIHRLKISEIAAAAGIGKGTVYEYFESKEALTARTLLYCMERESALSAERLAQCEDFKTSIFEVFAIVKGSLANPMSSFHLMVSGMPLLGSLCGSEQLRLQAERMTGQIAALMALGEAEGLVQPASDLSYRVLALKAAVAAYVSPAFPPIEEETLRETAWQILLKLLA